MTATKLSGLSPYYSARGITLYCADYSKVLRLLTNDSIDALITDPPYATTNLDWDRPLDWSVFWPDAIRLCRPHAPMVLFASGKFVPVLINSNAKHYRYDLIWEKNLPVGHLDANRRPLRSHESILVFAKQFRGSRYSPQLVPGKPHKIGKGKPSAHYGKASGRVNERITDLYHPRSVLHFNNSRSRSLHPTQKPLDLMKWLINTYTRRGDTILEPFAGSGSTLAAARQLGRNVIAVEQNEEYCKVIVERLESDA